VRLEHPFYRSFECEGVRILMTHIGLKRGSFWAYNPRRPVYDADAKELIDRFHPDIFICGHSHIPQVFRDRKENFLFMNPGACGFQGSRDVPRMALRFKIIRGQIMELEKCELPWQQEQ
jgi:Predicted phosphoesterase